MILEVENLQFGYEQLPIINGLNLHVNAGETLAIVGASGSGKSTLLHLLAGLDKPQNGSVKLCGEMFSAANDDRRSQLRSKYMGFVYQFHHLLAEFSALENVALPLLIAGEKKKTAHARAAELLEKVGLKDRIKHLPAELSGGERQRAAIARALVNRPVCLLADEPTGNLDHDNARQAFDLMNELVAEQQSALVIVTHDLTLAEKMQRRLTLKNGVLVQI